METPNQNKNNPQEEKKENLPGYPHYPESEDILSPKNDMQRVEGDVEALPRSNTFPQGTELPEPTIDPVNEPSTESMAPGPNDITRDDLVALGDENLANDLGEDEELKDRVNPVDMAASDLDIPGSELDDESEQIGSEDEENNFYSLGGDRHD